MSDLDINTLVQSVDDTLSKILVDTDLNPLELSAIILARLVRMNQEFSSHEEFKQIMETAILKKPEPRIEH
jgi:hypothetical protein